MVYHVLKDGSVVDDIAGKVVRVEDAEAVYNLINTINGSRESKENREVKLC